MGTENIAYSSIDGILYNKSKTTLISYPSGKLGSSFIVPSTVTSFGNSAFAYSSNLISINMGNSVTNIDAWAFYKCTKLTSITIPGSVTSIRQDAFLNCASLAEAKFLGKAPTVENSEYGVFGGCASSFKVHNF